MAFGPSDAALSTTFGRKKRTDNFDRMSYLANFSTKRRTRRYVASTKSRMRPIVVMAKWFSTNCHAPPIYIPMPGKCNHATKTFPLILTYAR